MRAVANMMMSNGLLAALPTKVRQRFAAEATSVELKVDTVLAHPGQPIERLYFPTAGFVSLIAKTDVGASLEVGLIGSEGMLGVSVLLGVDYAPLMARVLGAGSALCVDTIPFQRLVHESPPLQRLLQRYLHVVMGQLAQSVACIHYHRVDARLARWLLMTQDRAHSDAFHMTHEVLAGLLGVRRVGITKAAMDLQQRKLIRYSRGNIRIVDRAGLIGISCGCYESANAIYGGIWGKTWPVASGQ